MILEVCETYYDNKGAITNGKNCPFPFEYLGIIYNGCVHSVTGYSCPVVASNPKCDKGCNKTTDIGS